MKVYYAHSMHLYGTPQEQRDVELLESMGFTVVNPNNPKVQKDVEVFKLTQSPGTGNVMNLFKKLIETCDILAYRSHVDLRIPSGIMFEVDYAIEINKPVFELPTLTTQRRMTYEETVEYLKYNGQR